MGKGLGLLVLSCCSRVKFTKSNQQVCFSSSDGRLLASRSGDRVQRGEVESRRCEEKIKLLINLPLLCGCIRYDTARNLSPWMEEKHGFYVLISAST